MITSPEWNNNTGGYSQGGRAEENPYPHDGCADMDSYPHDGEIY